MADEKQKLPEGNSLREREKREVTVHRNIPEKKKDDGFVKKAEDFFDPIINDVLIPSAQDTIMDIVNSVLSGIGNSICEAITGQPMRRDISVSIRRNNNNRRTDYTASSRSNRRSDSVRDERTRVNETSYIRDLSVFSHADARNVIDQLYQILEAYGHVSCNDLYGLEEIDKTCPFTYANYGWYNLDNPSIIDNRDGTWSFDLPKPVPLNR